MQSFGRGGGSDGGHDKSPLTFFKNLTEKKTKTDVFAPRRRGPKPDSKPALTRRQELNRQAQRTHRERKESYIKSLEDEVLRLKEIYSNVSQAKDSLSSENRQLKQLLAQNGIASGSGIGVASSPLDDGSVEFAFASSSAAGSGYGGGAASSHTSAFTPPPLSAHAVGGQHYSQNRPGNETTMSHSDGQQQSKARHHSGNAAQTPGNSRVDYDQAGIDFVLALEKPCMKHLPWLLERGTATGGGVCGHALMASCPPEPFPELTADIPFGYANVNNGELDSGQRTWELSKGDLNTLLDLSKRLELDGEITPVMAWGMILAHPRLMEMSPTDFQRLTEELGSKVRCYGFGAVLEDFEARDAIENLLSTKPDACLLMRDMVEL